MLRDEHLFPLYLYFLEHIYSGKGIQNSHKENSSETNSYYLISFSC